MKPLIRVKAISNNKNLARKISREIDVDVHDAFVESQIPGGKRRKAKKNMRK